MENKGNSIREKLYLMQGLAGYMKKDTRAFNFNYVDEEAVLSVVKPMLKDFALEVNPEIATSSVVPVSVTKIVKKEVQTTTEFLFVGHGHMTITDIKTGENLNIPWVFTGSAEDPSQAFGSAMTYSSRYFWLKTLQIPTGNDDPDHWRSQHMEQPKQEIKPEVKLAPKPVKSDLVTPEMLEEIRVLVTVDGKQDAEKSARMQECYKHYGYSKASEIKVTDYKKIVDDFGTRLPFELA